ncbi:MAG: DUF4139 domain-containing protein [Flavobacteriaceae bacterium]
MKKILLLIITLANIQLLTAQELVNSDLKKVTVFKNNANIKRHTVVNLKKGVQEIVLTGLTTRLNPSSIQVQLKNNNVELLSAKYEPNYLISKKDSPEIEKLKEALKLLQETMNWHAVEEHVLKNTLEVYHKNQNLSGDAGFTPNQVIELANVYRTKTLELKKELIVIRKKIEKIAKEKTKIELQLENKNAKFNKPSGHIVLKLDVKTATSSTIKFSYLVSNAGWSPLYDLRSEGITKNIQLKYKASIYQNTGIDWNNVPMIVSTGNPLQNNNRPILQPLFAQIYNPVVNALAGRAAGLSINKKEMASNMALEEVVVNKYKDGYNYNANIANNQLAISYELTNLQDIKSDGKENLVALKSYDVETSYVYHTVPKINSGAFLLAKISNWEKYNLETGAANIFFEGAYVGKTTINPEVTSKELLISMGLDRNIIVERKQKTDYHSKAFLANNKKETFEYDIIVKNKKNVAIDIEVLDQIPVSQNKKIKVELLEIGSATLKEDNGKVLWKFTLQPHGVFKEKFSYSVKYPKDSNVTHIK